MKNDADFYVGWQDKASPIFARPVAKAAIGLIVLTPLLALLLVVQQRGFSDAVFEYGQLTTVEGQLIRSPVPFIRVPVRGSTSATPLFERILLIGLGKHGADSTLHQWEMAHGSLTGKTLRVRGTLLYHEGRAVLELTEGANALLTVSTPSAPPAMTASIPLGKVTLSGEITDPKCFLGVMKPGDGRPHRSCAIRCISGGVPPLLYVNDGHSGRNGYVVVGADGEPINKQILAYLGNRVQLRGHLEQVDNWLMLYVDAPVQVVTTKVVDDPYRPFLSTTGQPIALCH
ncbi:hypothetical protein [Spirosoma linguale]|uniref:Uncharacterized protein n=1 Tax=Spirosoma linguale (strain ATCC 33905 / DSM 74 / LMG 10896 / Claus 1) TaxID=504472 RepID=D2QGN7_SPILD|nr:hypothetical protein Slin_2527 [Spirosoma linguale DSM 74]